MRDRVGGGGGGKDDGLFSSKPMTSVVVVRGICGGGLDLVASYLMLGKSVPVRQQCIEGCHAAAGLQCFENENENRKMKMKMRIEK